MNRNRAWLAVMILSLGVLLVPSHAMAQSTIAGTVKDSSGGALPGVTVQAASDVLIEKVRVVTTDGSGQYRIIDLRPGTYTITFALSGFATVQRAEFQLAANFNASVNTEMKLSALEETVTVTGAAPIVDVQSAAHVQALDRSALDTIPTSRSMQSVAQLILGVSLSAPDVGGSTGAMQTYMSMRGGSVAAANNTVMVDGMVINGLWNNGTAQTYTNDQNYEEVTYQTAGVDAERSGGGVAINFVPKEGGNAFNGTGSLSYRPGQLQASNYSDRFKLWGFPTDKNGDPAINRVKRISEVSVSQGGPIEADKLWFFVSARDFQPVNTVPNTFLDDGTQGVDDNYIRNTLVRLTYQMSPKHKLGAYYERTFKWRGHDMGQFADPETTAIVWKAPNWASMSAKYTGTINTKLLIEAGFSQNNQYYTNVFQDVDAPSNVATYGELCCGEGILKERDTAAWLAYASHSAAGGGLGVAPSAGLTNSPLSQVFQTTASYVTGSHHAKVGMSLKIGKMPATAFANADLGQVYPTFLRDENYNITFPTTTLSNLAEAFPAYAASGSPCNPTNGTASLCSVTIRNTPRVSSVSLNHDLGLFIQDTFTMKRLTLSGGLRLETLNSQVDEIKADAGRFVPVRTAAPREDIPDWKGDWAPRIQVVYDLFGDSKTAVKYSFNRYNEATTTGVAEGYNPLNNATSSRNWTDLNRDDVAQGQRTWNADGTAFVDCVYLTPGCEINLSGTSSQTALSPTFGLVTEPGVYTGYPRRYRVEHGFEVQHALLPRLSLTGTYYHGSNHNLTRTVNLARTDDGTVGTQYRPVTLYNPLDGTPFVYYNSIVTLPTNNLTDVDSALESSYDAYTAEVRMRPYSGAQMTGGIEFNRNLGNNCSTSIVKADGSPALLDPNNYRFCDDNHLEVYPGGPVVGKPFTKNFKLSGSMPTVYGINLGFSYQNIDSGAFGPSFRYGTAFKYPDGTMTYNMLGKSTPVPACPTELGCTPGAITTPANFVGVAGGTVIGGQFAPGTVSDERIVQVDVRLSKNFRVGRISLQPAFEAFNLMNIDNVRSRLSGEVANTSGTYLQPDNMLQGRILGFGANVKW